VKVEDLDILFIRDLTIGYDSSQPDKIPLLPVSSSSQMITLKLSNGCVFTIRTSGTEPKIKYYSEIRGQDADLMKKELQKTVKALITLILDPENNALIPK
jgi:phosphoglucomutase